MHIQVNLNLYLSLLYVLNDFLILREKIKSYQTVRFIPFK